MTGEVLAWYRVAARLGIPVEELREKIGRTEFLDWLAFLEWEETRTTKLDYYLAQITAEIVRAPLASKDRKRVKLEQYLIKLVTRPMEAPKETTGAEPTEEQKQRMQRSKAAWGSYLGEWQKLPMKKQPVAKGKKK